jgi:hypothetical protein
LADLLAADRPEQHGFKVAGNLRGTFVALTIGTSATHMFNPA